MMALNANILVSFLSRVEAEQAQQVHRLFKQTEADKTVLYAPLLEVLETISLLQAVYRVAAGDSVTA
jgi:predicted nucleic-acid-binding protein